MWRPTGVWRLNSPAKRRSRVSACHRMRSASVGFRRSSRASPRTVELSPGTAGPCPCSASKRPQPCGLFAVQHAALGRTLAAFGDRHDHPVQGVHVLLGRVHPRKNVAQVDQHGLALLARAQEFDLVEFPDQIVEEGLHLVLRGRLGPFGHREREVTAGRQLEPLVADQQHRLRQVERGKTRVDREGDDPVGERDLLVLQAVALPAEQDAGPAAAADMGHDLGCGFHRGDHRLGLVMGAGGGGKQQASGRRPPARRCRTTGPVPESGRRRPPPAAPRCSASRRAD